MFSIEKAFFFVDCRNKSAVVVKCDNNFHFTQNIRGKVTPFDHASFSGGGMVLSSKHFMLREFCIFLKIKARFAFASSSLSSRFMMQLLSSFVATYMNEICHNYVYSLFLLTVACWEEISLFSLDNYAGDRNAKRFFGYQL